MMAVETNSGHNGSWSTGWHKPADIASYPVAVQQRLGNGSLGCCSVALAPPPVGASPLAAHFSVPLVT